MSIKVTKTNNTFSVSLKTNNTFSASLKTNNTFSASLKTNNNYKITSRSGGIQVPAKFEDLEDFDTSGVGDNYIIMYDAVSQKYKPVNPDDILIKAVTDTVSPGIPTAFIDELDIDLDNKIDLDAGTF